MIDEALTAFLERGCAMIVGTVSADGAPHAQRAWGCRVLGPTVVRLLIDERDQEIRSHLDAGGRIAVTAADVRTLQAVQIKGQVTEVACPTADDLERCDHHNDELLDDIEQTDFFPRQVTGRMVPPGYVVAVVTVDEVFDQTPGPGAGAPVATGQR